MNDVAILIKTIEQKLYPYVIQSRHHEFGTAYDIKLGDRDVAVFEIDGSTLKFGIGHDARKFQLDDPSSDIDRICFEMFNVISKDAVKHINSLISDKRAERCHLFWHNFWMSILGLAALTIIGFVLNMIICWTLGIGAWSKDRYLLEQTIDKQKMQIIDKIIHGEGPRPPQNDK